MEEKDGREIRQTGADRPDGAAELSEEEVEALVQSALENPAYQMYRLGGGTKDPIQWLFAQYRGEL